MVAAFFSFAAPGATSGEVRTQLAPQFRSDPYITELDKILEEWNSGRLRFPEKSELAKRLDGRLKRILSTKRYSYQTEEWAKALRVRFDSLSSDLRPERKLTDPAALILMYLFVEGLEQFRKEVSADKAREELMLPIFMILGRAQEIAKSLDRAQMDSRIVLPSLNSWWTSIWPFCD